MSNDERDIDVLLRRNLERQLEGFDWDRQRQTVAQRLAGMRIRKSRRVISIGVATSVAALLMLAVGYVGTTLLDGPGRNATAPMDAIATQGAVENDSLLASTDPTTILLTGTVHGQVLNDPTLAPHSVWDQYAGGNEGQLNQGEPI